MDIACLDSILHREIGEKTEQGEKPGCYKFNSWNVKKNIRFRFQKWMDLVTIWKMKKTINLHSRKTWMASNDKNNQIPAFSY